jgi:hypothetical protein
MIGSDGGSASEGERRTITYSKAVQQRAALGVVLAIAFAVAWASPAHAAAAVDATPVTGLTDGATVSVTATGFGSNGLGAITQCNDAPNQPTIGVAGKQVPVSCTDPLKKLVNFDATGTLTPSPASFVVHTGVTGPPSAGTDSAGGDAAVHAADYPCPPTAAQIAAGASCIVAVGDASGGQGVKKLAFAGGAVTTTTVATSATTTRAATAGASSATTTTAPTQVLGTQVSRDPLATTGPSRGVLLLAILGVAVLDLGYLLESSTHGSRRIARRVRSWVTGVFR